MIRDVVILEFWGIKDTDGNTLKILSNDIVENSFSIDYNCVSGNWYSPGDAVMSELNFTLLNLDGKYDNYNFNGERVDVHIVKSTNEILSYANGEYILSEEYVNGTYGLPGHKGMFWVDTINPHQKGENIVISALDGLSRLNIPFIYNFKTPYWILFGSPTSVMAIAINSIPLPLAKGTTLTDYNEYYTDLVPRMRITSDLNDRFSLLQILQYIANLIGCVVICEGGTINFRRICDGKSSLFSIPASERFNFKVKSNSSVPVTGIIFDDGNKTYYYHNGSTYTPNNIPTDTLNAMNEGLVFTADYTDLLKCIKRDGKISTVLEDVTKQYTDEYCFYPFECDVLSTEYDVKLLDKITFLNDDGSTKFTSFITGIQYKLNGLTHIKCAGEYLSSASSNSTTSYVTQKGASAMIDDRDAITLTMSSESLAVGSTYTVGGFSQHSAFIVTVKRANDSGTVPLFCIRNGNDIRGSFIWRLNASTVYEYFLQVTDNGDDSITVDSLKYYITTSGTSTTQTTDLSIVKISAIS